MNQIVSLFMFSCGDYEKVKQDVWEENWKAMRLYSVVALVAFGVITLVSVFSLSIGKYEWVYLVYTFLSLVYFCISRCQLRSFLGKKLVVYSFFAALLLFGIITGTLIAPEELTVNYIVFILAAPLLFTARTAVMNGLILSSMLLYIGLAFFAQHTPILSKNLVNVILYGVLSMLLTAMMMRSKLQRILYHKEKEMLEVSKRESQERILNYERFLTDMVLYAFNQRVHLRIVPDLIGVIFKGAQLGNCNFGLFHRSIFLSFFRVRLLCSISVLRSASRSFCILGMCSAIRRTVFLSRRKGVSSFVIFLQCSFRPASSSGDFTRRSFRRSA